MPSARPGRSPLAPWATAGWAGPIDGANSRTLPHENASESQATGSKEESAFPFLGWLDRYIGLAHFPIARHVLGFNATGLSRIRHRMSLPPPPPPPGMRGGLLKLGSNRSTSPNVWSEAPASRKAMAIPAPKAPKGRADTDLPSTTLSSPALPHYH